MSKQLYTEIGDRIANLRHEQKLTQEQLAESMDISIKHLSEVERGLTCFSLEKLVALCSVLSTDLDYLIRGIDHRIKEESNTPPYILALFNSDDENKKQLLSDYLLIFKKIYEQK